MAKPRVTQQLRQHVASNHLLSDKRWEQVICYL